MTHSINASQRVAVTCGPVTHTHTHTHTRTHRFRMESAYCQEWLYIYMAYRP